MAPVNVRAPQEADLDEFVEAFEKAKEHKPQVDLASFLPHVDHPLYQAVLCELIRVDLDYGWQRGCPKDLDQYRLQFPGRLENPDAIAPIAFEEYRLRRREGEDPHPAEYRERFGVDTAGWPESKRSAPKPIHDDQILGPVELEAAQDDGQLPTRIVSALSEAPLEAAARAYKEFRRRSGDLASDPADDWASAMGIPKDHTRLFLEVHDADPEAASRLAEGLTSFPEIGSEFVGFHLVAEIGKGTFGRVYLAKQGTLADRFVVLKVAADIFDESQSLAQLQHTNIVPIYSIHRSAHHQAVCMPFYGSTTLVDVLRQVLIGPSLPGSGKVLISTLNDRRVPTWYPATVKLAPSQPPVPIVRESEAPEGVPISRMNENARDNLRKLEKLTYVDAILWMASRLADGLAHAHDRGILHRDLKPANILLTDEGQPMLLDFNLSEDTKTRSQVSRASVGGTLPYMAPEALEAFRKHDQEIDARSDVYSLGVLLYQLLSGRHPFPSHQGLSSQMLDKMIQDRRGSAPRLRCWNAAVTPAVESLVRHCLQPQPALRYQSAAELREDIERHLRNLPLKHAPEVSWREWAGKWMRRHPRLASLTSVGAILGTLLLVLSVAFVMRGRLLAQRQAKDTLNQFQEEMSTPQFLLYSRHTDRDQLEQGMAQCRATLDRYKVLENPDWPESPIVRDLSQESRYILREQIGELLFLLSRAASLHAVHYIEPSRRAEQLQQALDYNVAAASCYSGNRTPRALWEQRADLERLLGKEDDARALEAKAKEVPLLVDKDYYLLAHKHAIKGNYREAQELLRKATQSDPQNFSAWFVRGNCYYDLLQDSDAVACYNTCVGLRPNFHWSWYNRGLAHLRLKDYRQAVEDFDKALSLRPDLTDGWISRALAKQELKQYRDAIQDFSQALKSGNPSTRIYFLRAEARARAGDPAGANDDFENGLKQEPADERSWIARGLARKDRESKGALTDFETALKINPRSFEGLQNKAAILVEKFHRDSEALRVMDEAVRLFPDSVLTRGGRGVLLARAGKRARALEDAQESLILDTRPPTLYQVACIYALTSKQNPNDRLQALQLLSSALRAGFGLDWVGTDTDLDPIRNSPEFQRVVAAANTLQGGKAGRSK